MLVEEYVSNNNPNWFTDKNRIIDVLEFLKELLAFLKRKNNVAIFKNVLPDSFFPPVNSRLDNIFCDEFR